ncbi:SusC/RagA family TonB-linked outer membrane protein [Parapedobacter soli]|uniref:SusC/RagA family TonB-linked outer membrane protein n=1 Tax=Parapedobacter soli TaxID=416955 RepID=UPI0021CAB43D|nr:SusC/RagA family TonB-linked outer membrane protein [Parapedobacter soli]
MKVFLVFFFAIGFAANATPTHAQSGITGTVTSMDDIALPAATIRLLSTNRVIPIRPDGTFSVRRPDGRDTLLITHLGYHSRKIGIDSLTTGPIDVHLVADGNLLSEVEVNTGYYTVPQERATGSFTHIDNELLNRNVSTNILDRLEGVTNGLLFDRRNLAGEQVDGAPELRIRGISTIEANAAPLIVVDNFPYDGDINNLNPSMVESVTVLRDAAAASIWGARAGNGVIVITTKQGNYNQPARVSFSSNLNFTDKPDLFYNQNFLPSPIVMGIQKELFQRGNYQERDRTYIPSYVELLIKLRDGVIDQQDFASAERTMQETDLRHQASELLYRRGLVQRYAFSMQGGVRNYRYALSAGHDHQQATVFGNGNQRLSLGWQNSFKAGESLEMHTGFWYTGRRRHNNGITYGALNVGTINHAYDGLVNPDGSAAVMGSTYRQVYRESAESMGLLDWMYRPLDEVSLRERISRQGELRLSTGLDYQLLTGLKLSSNYQYILLNGGAEELHFKESYYVRNLVNRYTQSDGTRVIPFAAIKEYGPSIRNDAHSGRVMLNYSFIRPLHEVRFIAGAEIGQEIGLSSPGQTLYNFDPKLWTSANRFDYLTRYPTRPTGSAQIPNTSYSPSKSTQRYLSYFGNGSYMFNKRYTLSGSLRWDGSNLLGVKTNQRGTALWSFGGSWQLSGEPFYSLERFIPYLRLRATYGSAGNIDKTQSYYPTIIVTQNNTTGLLQSLLRSPGNPSLRWEQVNTANVGVDWKTAHNRIAGSFEYYIKYAKDLLGDNMMDPTSGIGIGTAYKMNYGNLTTRGWDIQVNSRNLIGFLNWSSTLLISHSSNKITHLKSAPPLYDYQYLAATYLEEGQSVDILYASPWHGLNPENGTPLIYIDGAVSDDYQSYWQGIEKSMLAAYNSVPIVFGSLRNDFRLGDLDISFLISFKTGHVFRRNSLSPAQEYQSAGLGAFHMDYFKRWARPGDERFTDVPASSGMESNNPFLSSVYQYSDALITKGDVIRLQDISLGYKISGEAPYLPVRNLKLNVYIRNVGILWRANKNGIDPDYPNADYPAPRSYAIGLQMDF